MIEDNINNYFARQHCERQENTIMMKRLTFCAMLMALVMMVGCEPVTYEVFATVSGTVVDATTMEPIEGVSVQLSPSSKNMVTAANGRFEFAEVDAVQYTITVQKSGYSTNRKLVNAIAGETTDVSITMEVKK